MRSQRAWLLAALVTLLLVAAAPAQGTSHQHHGHCRTHKCWHAISVERHQNYPLHHLDRYRLKGKCTAGGRWHCSGASWYGPGFYGHGMACGGPLLTSTIGVAHKTLPCGTRLILCAPNCRIVTVVDRGPYVSGREYDLTGGLKLLIGFGSTGTVRSMVLG